MPTQLLRDTYSVLVAEMCDADPYIPGLVSGDDHPGPLLTMLSARDFDALVLLCDSNDTGKLDSLTEEINKHLPGLEIKTESLDRLDFSDYNKTYSQLQYIVDAIRERAANSRIYVALNSENVRAHVAWIRMVYHNAGITLLQLDPSRHATSETPAISIVEESRPAQPSANFLREPVEPMSDEMARGMDLIGTHPGFRKAIDTAYEIARFDTPVLIIGEPGSGKTSVASFIWRASPRAKFQMQTTDPAGLPDPLASALLFGNAATSGKSGNNSIGLLASDNNGTVLIENVEKLCEPIQEALAEYLQTGRFKSIGAKDYATAGARLIFTSCDVSGNGPATLIPKLREILLPTTIRLPSLRERREDIPMIALHYLRRINMSLKSARSMPRDMLRAMQQYPWSGNVRELRLAIERAALLSTGGEMNVEDLSIEIDRAQILARSVSNQTPEIGEGFSLETYLGDMRRKIILHALELSKGNQSEAARMLHITPQAVHQFLKFQNKAVRGKNSAPEA
jgi:DNA-binding NtrC family response regulator